MDKYTLLGTGGLAVLLLSSCGTDREVVVEKQPIIYSETRTEYVSNGPPAERIEAIQPAPGSNYEWVKGHWTYRNGDWVWDSGYWAVKPASDSIWVAGHWEHTINGWIWHDGHWT